MGIRLIVIDMIFELSTLRSMIIVISDRMCIIINIPICPSAIKLTSDMDPADYQILYGELASQNPLVQIR